MTYISSFPSMTSPWGSFRSSKWRQPNYTLTRGRLSKCSVFFAISLRLFLRLNRSPDQVLPWVGCLCQVDQGVFVLHLSPLRTKFLRKNTSKYLWSQTTEIIFILRRVNKISFPLDTKSYPNCHLAEVVNVNTGPVISCCFWPGPL